MASALGFSDLPTEALDEIARRVGPLDNVLCSAVCRSWRRALRTTRLRLLGRRPSLPQCIHICPKACVVRVCPYRLSLCKYHGAEPSPVQSAVDEEVARARVISCSYGWAVTVHDDTWAMSLLDPFTGRSFPLPPFGDSLPGKHRPELVNAKGELRFWSHMFRKAALAPGRRLGTYAVMLLHSNGRGLSYLGPGATSWATLRPPRGMPHKYMDVIFHRGAFYTVSCYAELNAWMPDGGGGLSVKQVTNPRREKVWAVLADSMSHDGCILMLSSTVTHEYNKDNYHKYRYPKRPYKVHSCATEGDRRWLPVENPEEMLFRVGEGFSMCVPRSKNDWMYGTCVWEADSHWFFPYVPRLNPT